MISTIITSLFVANNVSNMPNLAFDTYIKPTTLLLCTVKDENFVNEVTL